VPPGRALIRRRCWAAKYSSFDLGNCSFYGPRDFIALCKNAMEQLSMLDPGLYEAALTQKLMLWYEPENVKNYFCMFGVPDSFVAWKEQGLISCVV